MLIFVAHKDDSAADYDRARRITHDLQLDDTANCYICPLMAFSHLRHGDVDIDTEMLICEDLLTVCDVLLVASELSKSVRRQIALARKIHMGVTYLEDRA